jgi:ectoine hydroxylase-related dioxygenase (phytanoyl-CoA dioxygenase family)
MIMATEQRQFQATDLTQAQIDQYRRDGFIQISNVFVGDELQAFRDAVANAVAEEVAAQPKPKSGETPSVYASLFIQKVNLWQRHEAVRPFVTSKRIGNIAARLEGTRMRLWHDHALFKEPGKGNNKTPWHQDAPYWPHQDRWHQTSIWIALKDATITNGCMSFVAGTHSLGPMPAIDLGNPPDIFQYAPHIKPVKPVTHELNAGSVTFHNGLTFHYAGPNKSDSTREAIAIIYMPENTIYDGKRHVCTDGMGFEAGQKLDHEMFPIVSD